MYGIFTYIWLIFMVNVGKYTSPMDPMDKGRLGHFKRHNGFENVAPHQQLIHGNLRYPPQSYVSPMQEIRP